MSFRLVPKSANLHGHERRNGRYIASFISGPALLYFLYSKHCDRPMSSDEERRPAAEFMRQFIVFCSMLRVRCRCKESSRSQSHLLMSFLLYFGIKLPNLSPNHYS